MLAWFRDRAIASKIFTAAAILMVAMVAVGGVAFLSLRQMHDAKTELHQASERLFVSGRASGYLLSYARTSARRRRNWPRLSARNTRPRRTRNTSKPLVGSMS